MKRHLLYIVVWAVALTACQESLNEKASREAVMYTKKNCPSQMSESIRMDSMTFDPATETLHYHYTLTGRADSIGLLDKELARQTLLTELKNTTSMSAYKEAGFRFAYTYRSEKSPQTIHFETVFSEKDYNKQ